MKDKKILLLFCIITIVLIISLTLDKKDIEGIKNIIVIEKEDEEISKNNKEKENEKTKDYKKENEENRDKKIYIEKQGDKTYIKSKLESINPITDLSWTNNNSFSFNLTFEDENIKNIIYKYDSEKQNLEKIFHIDGTIWEWKKVNEEGIVYSNDGFDGLFYMKDKDKKIKISESQEWYNISPDGKKVIVNGIPRKSNVENNERFIYYLENDKFKDANYIPDIDYVYSYIAASWSPDSIHIVSQIPGRDDIINIIDINEGIEKELKFGNSKLTLPTWSNDGKKLAFLIQSSKYDEYILNDLEMNYLLSDKIGIYDTETKEVKIINLEEKLTTSRIYWPQESNSIIIETAKIKKLNNIISRSVKKIDGNVEHISILNENKDTILEDQIDISEDYPVHKITPLKLFNNGIFLFMDIDKDVKNINIMDINKGEILSENIGYVYDISINKNDIYIVTDEGIFVFNENLKISNLLNFKENYGENILNVDANISPDYKKIALYVQYDMNSKDKTFIEIKDLK
ncbi:PD40 domain-containing protein [Senegalia massiliensis]|uniref:PD40 domain-containing protein n=1 Tax=Senegalia massiliensis TaxID=1720316 RepID=UPI00102FFB5A|nr:PD40 domain-containing protein [Senegalia massiliensis]